jgi:hypothetical protein
MVVAMGVKLQRHALGVTWVEQNAMARAAHALVDVRRVWLIDPYEDTEALAAVAELGTPAGVLQLLDRQRGKHVLPPVDQARAFARGCRTNTHRSRFVVTKSNGLISPEVKSLQGGARLPRDGRTRLRPGGTRRAIWRFSRGPTFVRQPRVRATAPSIADTDLHSLRCRALDGAGGVSLSARTRAPVGVDEMLVGRAKQGSRNPRTGLPEVLKCATDGLRFSFLGASGSQMIPSTGTRWSSHPPQIFVTIQTAVT